jgi:WD40 repeat protein
LPEGGKGNGGWEAGADLGGAPGAGGAAPECESCVIRAEALDEPCAGRSYRATLSIAGGEPPFSWQVSPNLEGWAITTSPDEPTQAILQSAQVAPGETELTVHVTDANGEQVSRSFTLAPRTSCWFAYTALGDEGPELRIVDPLAASPEPIALTYNANVFDFAFSPDGKYLAYSYGKDPDSPRGKHLALVDLETLADEAVSFGENRISAFAWSPDSTTLAAGFVADGTGYLGAIRVAQDESRIQATLAPTPAFVDTNLYWVGNQVVAYHAPVYEDGTEPGTFVTNNPDGIRTAFFVELGPSGFAPQDWSTQPFLPDVVMRATDDGFFMIGSGGFATFFYSLSEPESPAEHLDVALVSPSGNYSAAFESDDTLSILSAELGSFAPFAVAAQGQDCPMPLAWAHGAERIACLADIANQGTATHGEIRIFDLDPETQQLEMTTLADFCEDDVTALNGASCAHQPDRYAYGSVLASGAARAFSGSGRWLAFTAVHEGKAFLYTADLALRPFGLTSSVYFERPSQRLPTRIAFSPDERHLLFQLGPSLTLRALDGKTVRPAPVDVLTPSDYCAEDFTSAPDTYCANTEQASLLWSPDSKAFAFRTAGALVVASLRSESLGTTSFPSAACDGQCSGRFGFQPQSASTLQP